MSLFTKKDLGLLLPDDTPGDPVSLRHTKTKEETEVFKPLHPKVDLSKKVSRYRAGHEPKFFSGYQDERGFVTANSQVRAFSKTKAPVRVIPVIGTRRKRVEAQILSSTTSSTHVTDSREEDQTFEEDKQKSSSDDVAKALQDSSSQEEDDSDIDRRRRMLRMKAMSREAKNDDMAASEEKAARQPMQPQIVNQSATAAIKTETDNNLESTTSGSSSSGYDTDTDDSEAADEIMKPVFVPKVARESVNRQEELAAEEARRERRKQERLEARKLESRRLVAEVVQREQTGADKEITDVEMPDDTDGLDPVQEYRDWELREMRRIKRDHDRKLERKKEEEETLRRRNMTEEERAAEDAKLKKNEPKEKKKLKFMQKYYHKGAFYVDDDSISSKNDVRKRDASEATLEDKFDKEMLPTVMQVKNFGRAGRTKYTHLADQDTSCRDSLWARNDDIRNKYESRLSGMKNIEGSNKRRRKE
ncbi:uncharacterized protein CCR75_007340 [Bremia lactucae]|uniref:Micro-fibrillar-associated protein 1 C-terminal domain-containing protein n=1 Tax=Bremia lactucae TaxID=4779 RepID=A0A976IAW1_BRELC|nr:hypothetical protein CCR75_007340 [Bremia lactucae]